MYLKDTLYTPFEIRTNCIFQPYKFNAISFVDQGIHFLSGIICSQWYRKYPEKYRLCKAPAFHFRNLRRRSLVQLEGALES